MLKHTRIAMAVMAQAGANVHAVAEEALAMRDLSPDWKPEIVMIHNGRVVEVDKEDTIHSLLTKWDRLGK